MDIEQVLLIKGTGFISDHARHVAEHICKHIDMPLKEMSYSAFVHQNTAINRETTFIIGPNDKHGGAFYNDGPLIVIDRHTDLYLFMDVYYKRKFYTVWAYDYLSGNKGDIHLIVPQYESKEAVGNLSGQIPFEGSAIYLYNDQYAKQNLSKVFEEARIHEPTCSSDVMHPKISKMGEKTVKVRLINNIPEEVTRVSIDDDFVRGTRTTSLLNIVSRITNPSRSFELWTDPESGISDQEYTELIDIIRGEGEKKNYAVDKTTAPVLSDLEGIAVRVIPSR